MRFEAVSSPSPDAALAPGVICLSRLGHARRGSPLIVSRATLNVIRPIIHEFGASPRGLPTSPKIVIFSGEQESTQVQFAVGFRHRGKTGHVVVDAEDAEL
jgi:hypothetical protein